MDAQKIQKQMDAFHYWDARGVNVSCNYFADEAQVVYEDTDNENVIYTFYSCYKIHFDHVLQYIKDRPSKELRGGQVFYFMQDVEVSVIEEEGLQFYCCVINMHPLYLEIWCKDIKIEKKAKHDPARMA